MLQCTSYLPLEEDVYGEKTICIDRDYTLHRLHAIEDVESTAFSLSLLRESIILLIIAT